VFAIVGGSGSGSGNGQLHAISDEHHERIHGAAAEQSA
jgi:hypothetical protein